MHAGGGTYNRGEKRNVLIVSVLLLSLFIGCYHRLPSAGAHVPRLGLRPQLNTLRIGFGVLRLVTDYIDIHNRCVGNFRLTDQRFGFVRSPIAVVPQWFLRLGLDVPSWPFPPEGRARITSMTDTHIIVQQAFAGFIASFSVSTFYSLHL
jgi:hypothetical protein